MPEIGRLVASDMEGKRPSARLPAHRRQRRRLHGCGASLLQHLPACRILLADKGYDSDAIRRQVEAAGAAPNIPAKVERRWRPPFSPVLYRRRNAIERMFCRLKDWRRVATRHDRLAATYLATVCIAATVSCWF